MAQPSYRITLPGVLYGVSDNASSDMRLFMLYLIKNFYGRIFSLPDMKYFFGDDSKAAFKSVYYLISKGWIDIDESEEVCEASKEQKTIVDSLASIPEVTLVLSDSSGLSVLYQGLSRHDADCIAAQNRACLDTAMRSKRWSDQDSQRPSSFSIDWKGRMLTGQVWHVGNIPFSFTTPIDMPVQEHHLCHLIAALTRRYHA